MNKFSLFVGLRYTKAKRRDNFISFISLVSTIGIALGVMVLITVLSVMNGFDLELRERILGFAPHVTLHALDDAPYWQDLQSTLKTEAAEQVQHVTPFVQGQAILSGSSNRFALIQGILPEQETLATGIASKITDGQLDSLQEDSFNLVLGYRLAEQLGVTVGDKVTVIIPKSNITIGGIIPRIKRCKVGGIFNIGYEYDNNLALINLHDANTLLQRTPNSISGLNLRLDNLYDAPSFTKKMSLDHDLNYLVSDWTISSGNFFKAVQLEKTLMFLLLLFIVLVAAFNILATLTMMVKEKQADIAILRTMGATQSDISQIFLIQGLSTGVVGTLFGTILGLVLASNVTAIVKFIETLLGTSLLAADVYYISHLPSKILATDVSIIVLSALLMALCFSWYPARRAAHIQPAQALRYE